MCLAEGPYIIAHQFEDVGSFPTVGPYFLYWAYALSPTAYGSSPFPLFALFFNGIARGVQFEDHPLHTVMNYKHSPQKRSTTDFIWVKYYFGP